VQENCNKTSRREWLKACANELAYLKCIDEFATMSLATTKCANEQNLALF